MKKILKNVWQTDKKRFLFILLLNIGVALMGSISIVMLVPMLDLLDISVGESSTLHILLQPFAGLSYLQRATAVIVAFVAILLFQAILTNVGSVQRSAYMERYELRLRRRLYDALASANWETISEKSGADLINLFTLQVRNARAALQEIIALISSVFTAILQLTLALWMSWPVTVMAFVLGGVCLFLFRPFVIKSRVFGRKAIEANRGLHREIQNQLNAIKEIRAYGVEDHQAQLFENISQDCYDINVNNARLWAAPKLCYSIGAAILIAVAFVYSVLILKTGTAQLVILVYIFSRLWPIFSSLQGQLQNIQSHIPADEIIQSAIEELSQGTREPEVKTGVMPFQKSIAFEDVGFTYQNGSEEVLHDVNFQLPCGSVTALVGPSGAGKSTTADLLLGLLQPTKGKIRVDDIALTSENLGMWRKSIGYIPQEPLILNATVRENLLRFHPDATEEEMVEALKQSLAWPFVEKLPLGLDTVLGDKGVRLSGGERQRIVFARVLMGKPRFIILDEATSALDYESESFIRETIRSLRGNVTVLIIAHRMATIRGADRAIVLLNGKIAEQGALRELLDRENGYLAGMVSVE